MATAQITADRNAPGPQQPTVLSTANGVTQINIQTPSAAGVSRNTYSQFDVTRQGAILNNSDTDSATQLGGYVQGNPWLGTGSARIILNEVHSSHPSQLQGYVEVAGPRAEVIIANPAGIAVNGGGFINASAVTLTTGTPVLLSGNLEAYRVRGGMISIDGAGLDTRTADYAHVLARAVQANAAIWAQHLVLVTGSNDVTANRGAAVGVTARNTTEAEGSAPTSAKRPRFALDIAALGGLYAGHIYLIGTEAGLGVTHAGTLGATAGDLVLSHNGWLSSRGDILANGNVTIATRGDITTQAGLIAAQGNVTLRAQGTASQISLAEGATLAAGVDTTRTGGGTSGTLSIMATGGATLNGQLSSRAETTIEAAALDLHQATLTARNATLLAADHGIDATRSFITIQQTLRAQTGSRLTTDGATIQAEQLALRAHDISNVGGTLRQSSSSTLNFTLAGELNNTGGTLASNSNSFSIRAATLVNTRGKIAHAGAQELQIDAGSLRGTGGQISSIGALSLQAGSLTLDQGRTQAAQLHITADDLSNQGGHIEQTESGATTLTVRGVLDNSGGFIVGNGDTTLQAAALRNQGGTVAALGTLDATVRGTINNTAIGTHKGHLSARNDMSIQAAHLDNTGGELTSLLGALSISTQGTTRNVQGRLHAATDITLVSAALDNSSALVAGNNISITTTAARELNNHLGTLLSLGTMRLQTGALNNEGGLIQSDGALSVDTNGQTLTNTHAAHYAASRPTSDAADISGGIVGKDSVTLKTGSLNNAGGSIDATGPLHTSATELDNSAGAIVARSTASLTLASNGTLNNTHGLVYSAAALNVAATEILNNLTRTTNTSAHGLVANSINLHTTTLANDGGAIRAVEQLRILARDRINNAGGVISGETIDLQDQAANTPARTLTINNAGGVLLATQRNHIVAAHLSGAGSMSTQGDLHVDLQSDFNNTGTLIAARHATLSTTGDINNSGILQSGSTLALAARNLRNATNASITGATTQLVLTETLTNQGVIDSAPPVGHGTTRIQAHTIHNLGSARIYGDTIGIAASDIHNVAATIAARHRLDLGATYISNRDDATLLSMGDLHIGGDLGSQQQAIGAASALTNSAATIEALGNLRIQSGRIDNLNPDFQWRLDTSRPGVRGATYFTPAGTIDTLQGGVLASTGPFIPEQHGGYIFTGALSSNHKGQARADANSHPVPFSTFVNYLQSDTQPVVTVSKPARIASGADMTLHASLGVVNDQSVIVAGGALNISAPWIDNRARTVTVDATRHGTWYHWSKYDKGCGDAFKGCDYNYYAYRPSNHTSTVRRTHVLDTAVREAHSITPGLHTNVNPVPQQPTLAMVALDQAPVAPAPRSTAQNRAPGAPPIDAPKSSRSAAPDAATSPGSGTAKRRSGLRLPASSLYRINSAPASTYLVETDPRFTNHRHWLSSDYITAQRALAPNATHKRLGDGFYEQQRVREQVAELRGRRFLGDYTSDQQQYQALMDAGLSFATTHQLRPGIALSAAHVLQLTSDIVWLQTEDVILPDGKLNQVLVPRLYAAVRPGDLSPSGALLGGESVHLQASDNLRNSGTIQGRSVVQFTAKDIDNVGGQIDASTVNLRATHDIHHIGGRISAQKALALIAARDLNVASTTQSTAATSGNFNLSQSGIDRVATLHVNGNGSLLARAGNNVTLRAAQLQSGGDVSVTAGNSIQLQTVQNSQSIASNAETQDFHLFASQHSDTGTDITAGNTLQLSAAQHVTTKAAKLHADGALSITATGNVVLDAGQAQTHFAMAQTERRAGFMTSTNTNTQTQASTATAQATTVSGKNVSVQAGKHLLSAGTRFQAQDSIDLGGADSTLLYATQDIALSSTRTQTSSNFAGINLTTHESTDHTARTTAIGTRLTGTERVQIGVGNKTELQGTQVKAKDIGFVKTTPNGNGGSELILGGSFNTTQASHTEKSETAGVWQAAKGHGSTDQTLNQTRLQGTVAFDSALKIKVQIPDTKGGAELRQEIETLAAQAPGLDYLQQLGNNPNVQWDKVTLAHDKWNYSEQGLTPAGAALLAIAVAAYTGGMGVELLGSTASAAGAAGAAGATTTTLAGVGLASSTAATAAAASVTTLTAAGAAINAGFASLAAQASVAMVNNGGDVGKTLEQLGQEQSIKGLLLSMVTAGSLHALNAQLFNDSASTNTNGQSGAAAAGNHGVSTTQDAANFQQNLLKNVSNNVAGAVIDTAMNGKPLDEAALSAALYRALIATGIAQGAHAIGDAASPGQDGSPAPMNAFTHKLAHAVLGCAGGAATAGNSSGCAPGAAGAVVGELSVKYAIEHGLSTADALALAQTLSATAGVLVDGGGDPVAAVNIANSTGDNAAQHNTLYHFNKRLIARDSINDDHIVDLTPGEFAAIAAVKQEVLETEVAGFDTDAIALPVISDHWAKKARNSTHYYLSKTSDHTALEKKANMSYLATDLAGTRVFVQTGMKTTPADAQKNAQALSNLLHVPVGALTNNTQGYGADIAQYLPNRAALADALNEYQYRTLNAQGPTLIVTHSAGNNDANKALQLGAQLGQKYPNLSLLSTGSPISGSTLEHSARQTDLHYLGQVNDWRDPVTHSKIAGAVALGGLVGGAAAGIALAPATGGGSLYGFFYGVMGAGIGGGIGGGIGKYGIDHFHPFENYIVKPKSQSIMFDWINDQRT